MSWKAPPSIESSSTPPSKVLLQIPVLAEGQLVGAGLNRDARRVETLVADDAGSSTNAAFGIESAGGVGTPEFEVTHSGAGPPAFVAVHPAGSVGAVTPSKFSLNTVTSGPTTATEAGAEPDPPSVDVNEAVLLSVVPHVPLVVLVVTCTCVLVLPASVVGV